MVFVSVMSALALGAALEYFVAYDAHLLAAAAEVGLKTASPGLA